MKETVYLGQITTDLLKPYDKGEFVLFVKRGRKQERFVTAEGYVIPKEFIQCLPSPSLKKEPRLS